ncbi:MAG: hypothetical protein ABEJ08_00195 [Halobacteriaceae archaeon]
MASTLALAVTAAAFAFLVGLHTVVAAVSLRFFRLRLATRWAPVLYTALAVPVVYLATTLVILGALGVGGGVTVSRGQLVFVVMIAPLLLGYAVELFWLPPVDEVDLPERT